MKKQTKYFLIAWLISVALFHVVFIVPDRVMGQTRFDKPLFWVTYALVLGAFLLELITMFLFLKKGTPEKKFLGLSLVRTGLIALILTLIVGIVFMCVPVIPTWIGAIVCLLIAGISVLAVMRTSSAITAVESVGEQVKAKTEFMRLAAADAQTIMDNAPTPALAASAKKVYEAIRYSDYTSHPALAEIESKIEEGLKAFKQAVDGGDEGAASAQETALIALIKERGVRCKALK